MEPSSCNILLSMLPPCVNFMMCFFSFLGATRRSSTTLTSTTRTRFTATPSPQPPPSARQWWRCKTAPGGATSLRCTWSRGKSPSATGAPPSSTRNAPRTLTAPRSTTTPRAPAAGSSPQCSWSRARIRVPASSTQRICRAAGCSSYYVMEDEELRKAPDEREIPGAHQKNVFIFTSHGGNSGNPSVYLDFLLMQSLKRESVLWQFKAAPQWLMSYLKHKLTNWWPLLSFRLDCNLGEGDSQIVCVHREKSRRCVSWILRQCKAFWHGFIALVILMSQSSLWTWGGGISVLHVKNWTKYRLNSLSLTEHAFNSFN